MICEVMKFTNNQQQELETKTKQHQHKCQTRKAQQKQKKAGNKSLNRSKTFIMYFVACIYNLVLVFYNFIFDISLFEIW
jgi:Flp pilus assembly protein TadB